MFSSRERERVGRERERERERKRKGEKGRRAGEEREVEKGAGDWG